MSREGWDALRTGRWVYRNIRRHPNNAGLRQIKAFIRFARFQIRGRVYNKRTPVPLGMHSHFLCDIHFGSTWRAAMGNPPDVFPMGVWSRILRPGDLFIDGGANAGSYTIFALDIGASVIAIEPNETARSVLFQNLRLNGYRCEVLGCALTEEKGVARMTIDLEQANRLSSDGVEVDACTLDDIIGNRFIDGIKLDIEGAEILALQGARHVLGAQRVRAIQLEWTGVSQETVGRDRSEVADLLQSYGYELFRPGPDGALREVVSLHYQPDLFALSPGERFRLNLDP